MESIFTRLSKFRPRKERNSEEDFFTEVFAEILSKNKSLAKHLLRDILDIDTESESLQISTQIHYQDSGRPDMTITGKDIESAKVLFLFEHKIMTDRHEGQLEQYARILHDKPKEYTNRKLIYITLSMQNKEEIISNCNDETSHGLLEDYLKCITWNDVYRSIKDYPGKNSSEYVSDFLMFMKEKNMVIEKVTFEVINGAKSLFNLSKQLKESISRLKVNKIAGNSVVSVSTSGVELYFQRSIKVNGGYVYIVIWFTPLKVIIASNDFKKFDVEKKKTFLEEESESGRLWKDYKILGVLDLSADGEDFLCLSADKQIDKITKLIYDSISSVLRSNE